MKLKETKTEIRKEMDERFNQQSKEIGEELSNVVIFLEKLLRLVMIIMIYQCLNK